MYQGKYLSYLGRQAIPGFDALHILLFCSLCPLGGHKTYPGSSGMFLHTTKFVLQVKIIPLYIGNRLLAGGNWQFLAISHWVCSTCPLGEHETYSGSRCMFLYTVLSLLILRGRDARVLVNSSKKYFRRI